MKMLSIFYDLGESAFTSVRYYGKKLQLTILTFFNRLTGLEQFL
jgi:hypothetical protein